MVFNIKWSKKRPGITKFFIREVRVYGTNNYLNAGNWTCGGKGDNYKVKKTFENMNFWLNLSRRNACKVSNIKQLCDLTPLRKFSVI